ncbi:MAG TPA: 4-alpha-glucanotransferase [Nevskia sp.]|nr:4-alpha-glucanotransferase [Nevskia sp.]
MNALHELAHAAGLAPHWSDYRGQQREVSPDSLRRLLAALELPADSEAQMRDSRRRLEAESAQDAAPELLIGDAGLPTPLPRIRAGTARLEREDGSVEDLRLVRDGHGQALLPALDQPGYYRLHADEQVLNLAVTPPRCYEAAATGGGAKLWGIAAQMYGLRQPGDGGIGNFTALAALLREAAGHGADAVAISPIHALFSADVGHYSPYSPSSRLFLNVLHGDPAAVFGTERVAGIAERLNLLEAMRGFEGAALIDWPAAAAAKLSVLQALYAEEALRIEAGADPLSREYQVFMRTAGMRLREHACFEALHAAALKEDGRNWHWRSWPAGWRDPGSAEVAAFAALHPQEIGFHMFLQWLADRGLRQARQQADAAGMRIGLIADLAVGTSSGGSHVWSRQDDVLVSLGIGAPPDELNGLGQDWGLTAFSPRALRRHGYAPFIETLRASLRHARGLRIDHILGLSRLWLIPEGAAPTEGAYLSYPLHDLLRLLALESWRHRAVIIGEDLGTIPDGFRQRLAGAGILGMQLLWFERDHGYFIDPSRWSAQAMASTSTHDLPTVAGWWRECDLDWRCRLGLFPPGTTEASERGQRARDRRALWGACTHAGVTAAPMPPHDQPETVVDAALEFVARSPSPLMVAPLDDLLGLDQQANIPGTVDGHPNWRRRLPDTPEAVLRAPAARRRLGRIKAARLES